MGLSARSPVRIDQVPPQPIPVINVNQSVAEKAFCPLVPFSDEPISSPAFVNWCEGNYGINEVAHKALLLVSEPLLSSGVGVGFPTICNGLEQNLSSFHWDAPPAGVGPLMRSFGWSLRSLPTCSWMLGMQLMPIHLAGSR